MTSSAPQEFAGQVVWITGSSSGIGRALAIAAHRAGARIILSARRSAVLEEVREACGDGPRPHVLPLDLSDLDALPGKVAEVLASHGRVDFLIHNAAIALRERVVDTDLAVHQRIMATNYFGPVALTKAVLPSMLERRSGHFVVISSLSGRFGGPQGSAYAASKHALEGFFESLEAEVHDQNIRVTTVVPGFIRTSILESALTGNGQAYGRNLAVHERGMDADECARRILRGIARGRREILVGGLEMGTVYLKRFVPGLLAWLVRRHPMRLGQWLRGLVTAIALALLPANAMAQNPAPPAHRTNVLYVNPVHLANGNITLTYERFTAARRSFRVTLSGGEEADYVAVAADLNHYPAPPAAVNYFIGGSLMGYESPIVTGVPIAQPWNRFFESGDDRYYLAVQVKNGGLFRLRDFLYFGIDAGIGPALSVSTGEWLWVWGIGLNLGIPF